MGQGSKGATILVWTITAIVALGIGSAGVTKFLQPHRWESLFASWGYPTWVSAAIGVIEVAAALALFLPRLSAYAGIVLAAVMTGAVVTLLTHPGGPFGWGATPLVYVVLLAALVTMRWSARVGVVRAS